MDAKLVAISKRINAALDRVDEERAHVADIYAEAKSAGYIPKILRKAITRQRMDAAKRQEEDSILDLYDHALGTLGAALQAVSEGATWDDAVKQTGVPRATLARAAAVSKRREMIPNRGGEQGSDDAGRRREQSHPAEQSVNASSSLRVQAPGFLAAKDDNPAPNSETAEVRHQPGDDARTPEPSRSAEVVSTPSDDGLDIPPALRRTRAA